MEEIQNVVRKERAQHPELRQKVRVLVEEDGALLKEVIQLQQSPVESQAEDPQRQAEALRGRSLACRKVRGQQEHLLQHHSGVSLLLLYLLLHINKYIQTPIGILHDAPADT